MIDRLRTRATGPWPCLRDLVCSYRAGERDPRDFEPALPELDVAPIAHAIFAKLAPGRLLSSFECVEGQTYDWGQDLAASSPEGDGILVAEYAVRERARDVAPSRTVHHVVVGDDACVILEDGSAAQRIADPRIVVRLSATTDAIDAVTDAVLELVPTFGLTFVERVDVPVRIERRRRTRAAVRAFEQVLASGCGSDTAQDFAWIVIGMVPDGFDFAPDKFYVQPGDHSISLCWRSPSHPARLVHIELTSSRNIECIASEDNSRVDRGGMSMHYTPSREQYLWARETLWCALHWLGHPIELPNELLQRIGTVFQGAPYD